MSLTEGEFWVQSFSNICSGGRNFWPEFIDGANIAGRIVESGSLPEAGCKGLRGEEVPVRCMARDVPARISARMIGA